jgi:hypothetical protein
LFYFKLKFQNCFKLKTFKFVLFYVIATKLSFKPAHCCAETTINTIIRTGQRCWFFAPPRLRLLFVGIVEYTRDNNKIRFISRPYPFLPFCLVPRVLSVLACAKPTKRVSREPPKRIVIDILFR